MTILGLGYLFIILFMAQHVFISVLNYLRYGDDWFGCGFKNLAIDKSVVAVKLLL